MHVALGGPPPELPELLELLPLALPELLELLPELLPLALPELLELLPELLPLELPELLELLPLELPELLPELPEEPPSTDGVEFVSLDPQALISASKTPAAVAPTIRDFMQTSWAVCACVPRKHGVSQ